MFTRCKKCLFSWQWFRHSIPILRCSFCSNFVKTTLIRSGFVPNVTKPVWNPCQCIFCLSIKIDIKNSTLSITSSRITSILNKIEFLINKIYIFARELAELAGKIISTKFIIGNITDLKPRNIYKIIESRPSWDNKLNLSLYQKAIKEIISWKNNIKIINKIVVTKKHKIPSLLFYSEGSNSDLASVYKEKGKADVCYKSFSDQEKSQSCTWRELATIGFSLNSSKNKFENNTILW